MSSDMRWRLQLRNLQVCLRIGIHPHEQKPQRVFVNAAIEGDYPLKPQTIEECFNYDDIHRLVVNEWPERTHTDLLETYVIELLQHIFSMDKRVEYAKVSLSKPDIFPEAESVGVEAEWTREDFNRLCPSAVRPS
ncbi:MAG: dihydroneopterin aldolase [Pseudomonadota bacterium]|nr:dihydroneopterin aldolase [Pseudomonadota bacterium]